MFDLFFLERDLNQPFRSASCPWFSLVRVLLDSQKVSSSLVSVPVDLDSLVGLGGLGLPLGVDRRLRWLYSSCKDMKSIHQRPREFACSEGSFGYYIYNAANSVFVLYRT